jgi:hypothetical protein
MEKFPSEMRLRPKAVTLAETHSITFLSKKAIIEN